MANDFWQVHAKLAAAAHQVGDLLLLADEAPRQDQRVQAWIEAAKCLHDQGHGDFARELLGRVLAIDAGNAEAQRLRHAHAGTARMEPRQVLLFSGHMLDAPDRAPPRFPAAKVPQAAQRIADVLVQLDAGPQDIALTQGACGGDLLFSEACRQRGVQLFWLQPFAEAEFIERSVAVCGGDWLDRYEKCKAALAAPPRAAQPALGPAPAGKRRDYAYERCNLWLLYTALAHGPDKLHLVCLWNGAGSEGPGGTGHMADEVKRRHGQVSWIDTRRL